MTSKFLRSVLAISFLSIISAWAQTGAAASTPTAPLPAAPSGAGSTPAASTPVANGGGTKLGTINIEQAVLGSNEGQRDFDALSKKLDPKRGELKAQNDELEGLQKQLQTQGEHLNEDARANLVKQIETKKKALERSGQDFNEDAQNQEKEIFQRILQKMGPVIVKHAQENGYGMIVDTSNPWPQGPVLWYSESGDITRAVVETYNAQSGVPAPASTGATKPAPRPAAPKTATPQPTTPPK